MSLEAQKQERTIGSDRYWVQPVPFEIGRKALVSLIKLFGGALMGGASAAAIAQIVNAIDDDKIENFAEIFGKASWVEAMGPDGGPVEKPLVRTNRTLHFEGKYYEFSKWLAFCVEVNYGPFFVGIKADLEAAIAAKAKPEATAPSSKASSDGSGEF
jgi:hypothetical protein